MKNIRSTQLVYKTLGSKDLIPKNLGSDIVVVMDMVQISAFDLARASKYPASNVPWDGRFDVAITTPSSYNTISNGPTIPPA